MFTLFDVLGNVKGVLVYIDSIIFGLIDDAYNLIYLFGSNSLIEDTVIKDVIHNLYFVICIFAFFKLAMLLVNAIINPDKLSDKEQGAGKVVINILVMFVLLIAVPIIFTESREITSFILGGTDGKNGNYINKLILGTDVNGENPGSTMKKAAISALIFPESDFVDGTSPSDLCTGKCADAVNDYYAGMAEDTADVPWSVLSHYMDVKSRNSDGDEVYVYHYTVLLTAAVGIFITYVLFSFVIDIAIRAVKMAILEMLAPLFIVSYIDPKSAKSGPFHNWVKTTLQVYASLFIKLAVISIMLLLLQKVLPGMNRGAFKGYLFAKIIVILAILIFIKSAPDWISSLIGIKSDDTSFKGIGKQLASAALVGGALTKAGHAALGAATGAAKMVGENRRNRNALRKQARINSGTTHGTKGKEFRKAASKDSPKNGIKGYFAGRHALHEKRKEAYDKANANLLGKGANGKNAVGRNLKQIGASIVGGAIVGGQAGIKADNIKGTLNAAKGAASQFGQGLGFQGRTIGGAINYGLENAKGSISNAWGNESERYDARQEAEKAEKAIKYRASGTNYTHGVEKGTIGVGDKEVHKVKATEFATSTDGVKFEMKTDADKLAKQFAVTTGSTKIDTSTTKDGEKIYNFTGEDGKVVTKTEKEIRTTCGGVLTAEGVDNFLKSSYNDDQNAVSAYNDNMQAQANAVSSYNQAQANAQMTGNQYNNMLSSQASIINDIGEDIKNSAFATLIGSSIENAIGPISKAITSLNELKMKASEDDRERFDKEISLLSQLKQTGEANLNFNLSAQTSMEQLQGIVESQKELAPIVNSVEGNTVAEKLQTLSRNSSAIEKRLKMYDKEKKD